MVENILRILKQPSTLSGIVGFLAVIGVSLSPEQMTAIVTAAGGIISAILVFLNDEDKAAEKVADRAAEKTAERLATSTDPLA